MKLSNKQKFILVNMSRKAWRAKRPAGVAGEDWMSEEDFRHEEVARAVGKAGLTCCGQSDYKALMAHFYALLGDERRAVAAHMDAETEPRRAAEAAVMNACQRAGVQMRYAEAICRNVYKCGLMEAATNQLWNLRRIILSRVKKEKGVAE